MKKYLLLVMVALCSCKSISYSDVNPTASQNPVLLPAMGTIVNMYNLESTYSAGGFTANSNTYGANYDNINYWDLFGTNTVTNGTNYKDDRVSDVVNIFEKEVQNNITSPYGAKKGYFALKLGYRGSEDSILYPLVSIFSLGMLNLVGFPYNELSESLEVQVDVLNKNKELIKRYNENIANSNYVAMWWGYDEGVVYRKVAADNIRQALEKIRISIANDANELNKKLK